MAVDPAVILAVVGVSSIGAVITAAKSLIKERFRFRSGKAQPQAASPQGEIVIITVTDSDGNTFNVSPTESEGKLIEKLMGKHAAGEDYSQSLFPEDFH